MPTLRAIDALPWFLLALAGCGERVDRDAPRRQAEQRTEPGIDVGTAPVRVGEAGPSFAACQASGTPRARGADEGLAVRAAPFESARTIGRIPAPARFFVCTRSHDQDWLGIVYADSGALEPLCNVAAPAPRRTDYAGPCRSGWVASASVRLVAA